MKKSLLIISVVVTLIAVVGLADTRPAYAKGIIKDDPLGCEAIGGNWVVIGENKAKCVFSPDHFWSTGYCPAEYSAVDYWIYDGDWDFIKQSCKLPHGIISSTSLDVAFGEPLDLWNGDCGAYISAPPVSGSAVLHKVLGATGPNFQSACHIKYFDFDGNDLSIFGSHAWVYFNLNSTTAKLWNDGKLNMYIFQSNSWEACNNPLIVDAGEFGRIACYANNPSKFGIGTSIKNNHLVVPGGHPFP